MTVPEPRSAITVLRAEVAACRARTDALYADYQILLAAHEHESAAHRVETAQICEYRRCLVALLGDNLPDGHRAWVRRLLDRHPVGL